VEHVSWQSIFFINLPVAAGAVAVALFATHESRDETVVPKVDVGGIVTITVGLTALTLALVEVNSWGWGSPRIIGLFALAAAGLAAFAYVERRAEVPMVDFGFFRAKTFLGANLVAFIVSFAMLAMFFFISLYMQNVLRFSPLEAGLRFLPTTLMVVTIAPIAGRLTDRIGPRPLMTAGLTLVAISLFWQSFLSTDTGFDFLLPGFVLMGIGISLVMAPMSTAAMNSVDKSKAGVASGILSMSRMVGATLGVAVLGAFIGRPGASQEFVHSLGQGLKVGAAVAALGAVVAWALISPRLASAAQSLAAGEVTAPPAEAAQEPVGA
jgi:MFS family permease